MDYKGYKKFYVNGTSHSQGGGLEEPELRGDSVMSLYEEKCGTPKWSGREEVNFAARLSSIIGIEGLNEAQSGGSVERIVRMSYDWILDNWEDRKKIFLILENPDASRFEAFYKPTKDYYIVNSNVEDGKGSFVHATREYFNKEKEVEDKKLQYVFREYFDKHCDIKENWKKGERDFIGLYSFCKMNGIKIFVMTQNSWTFRDCFQKEDVIKFGNDEKNYDISSWAYNNKKTIKDELDGLSSDGHPGYYAHIEYAQLLKEFLDKRL